MNYKHHYDLLIQRARGRKLECYVESHHVIPRCMGGEDGEVVDLTPEEHYVAHQLLVKMYPGVIGLVRAVWWMSSLNNKQYGWLRKKASKVSKLTADTNEKCIATRFKPGQRVSRETEFKKGHIVTEDVKASIREGAKRRDYSKRKVNRLALSEAAKRRNRDSRGRLI